MVGSLRSRFASRAPLGTWLFLAAILECSRSSLDLGPAGLEEVTGGSSGGNPGEVPPGMAFDAGFDAAGDGSEGGPGAFPDAATASDAAGDAPATYDGGYDPPGTVASALQLNAAHDGTNDDPLLVGPLVRLWTVTLPEAVSYPIIARDIIVVVTSNGGDGSQAQVWALHGHTGAPAWGPINLGVGGPTSWTGEFGAATYENGRVFTTQTAGTVRAFDIATGDAIWSTPGGCDGCPPTAYGGIVYTEGVAGTGGGLVAIDEGSGQILWQAAATQDLTIGSDPAVTPDGVFVSHACQSTSRYDRLSGTLIWQTWDVGCASGGGAWAPVVTDGLVYAREDDDTFSNPLPAYVLQVSTGADAGAFTSGAPPAVHAGHIFVISNGILSSVVSLDQTTAWTFGDGTLVTPPIVVSGRVFVGSTTGTIFALDETTGTLIWSDVAGTTFGELQEGWGNIEPTALAAAGGLLAAPVGNSLVVYGVEADAGQVDAAGDGG